MRSEAKKVACRRKGMSVEESPGHQQRVTIDSLPVDVLLEIFKVYLDEYQNQFRDLNEWGLDAWHTLVHVCHRWRCVAFDSPRYLGLTLLCANRRSTTKMLGIWPALPIAIRVRVSRISSSWQDTDNLNVLAALEQHDRVSKIFIDDSWDMLSDTVVTVNKPLPALTDLILHSFHLMPVPPTFGDSFLGGSTPRLRYIEMQGIPFPGIGKLISSATGLVELHLCAIPETGYITPEAMATSLTTLANLESFSLEFLSSQSWASGASRHPPLSTPIVLPALTSISFLGDSDYLEIIVSRIDTPLLKKASLAFFEEPISDTPLLRDFISRASASKTSKLPKQANVIFSNYDVEVRFIRRNEHRTLTLEISCENRGLISSNLLVCGSVLPSIPTLKYLEIGVFYDDQTFTTDDIENIQWLEFLRLFSSVKHLTVRSTRFARHMSLALAELAEQGVMEVLPMLQDLTLDWYGPPGTFQVALDRFIAIRQRSGRPVTVYKNPRFQ